MENLEFSEEEIKQQLEALGYTDIPKHRLREFKCDLDELIRHEKSKSQSSSSNLNSPARSQSTSYLSLPTYTKVKVQSSNASSISEFYPKSDPEVYERQVFASNQRRANHNVRTRTKCYDSYTQHTVASKYPQHFVSPNRLEGEADETDMQHFAVSQSPVPERDTGGHGRPLIKRKVLRKLKGQFHVCDESAHSEDSVDEASGLEEQLGELHVSMSVQQDSELEREEASCQSDRQSLKSDGFTLSAFESYMREMARSRSEADLRPRPKSFIRPMMGHPHTRNLIKTDPVTKYFQYKQDWETFKTPGERDRKALHWGIREQLAYQPPPPKPRRVFVPNTYVVPTEKKRSALRWGIRNDLANGFLPPRVNYRL